MRHRLDKKSFNRDTKARQALLLGVAVALLDHGEVVTTKAKGRQAARWVEKAITLGKKGDLAARRQLHRLLGKRSLVNNVCDRVVPAFKTRQSGFTKLTLVGNRRGDNACLYRLSLTEVLPPSKKQAELTAKQQQASEKKIKGEEAKKAKRGLFARKEQKNPDAQVAIKHDLRQDEKLRSQVAGKATRTTARTDVGGGGRGK